MEKYIEKSVSEVNSVIFGTWIMISASPTIEYKIKAKEAIRMHSHILKLTRKKKKRSMIKCRTEELQE